MGDLLKRPCPNCESAWTGGDPNPEEIDWCVVCSDPKTGRLTGRVWRWAWLQRALVVRKNFAAYHRRQKGVTRG